MKAGDAEEELALCRRIVADHPDRPAPRMRLLKLVEKLHPDTVADEARAARQRFPDRPEPDRALARAAERSDDDAGALAIWQGLADRDPDDRAARAQVARLAARLANRDLQAGKLDAARTRYIAIRPEDATGPEVLLLGAALARLDGRADMELDCLSEAARRFPDRLNPQLQLLKVLEARDHPHLARHIRTFSDNHPDRVEPHLARIRQAERQDRADDAMAAAEKAVAAFPDTFQSWMALARQWRRSGDWDRCESVLTQALDTAPDWRIRVELARLLLAAGRDDDALAVARTARSEAPQAANAIAAFAQALYRSEGLDPALAVLDEATDQRDPALLSEAATLRVMDCDREGARDAIARLTRHAPDHKTTVPLRIWAHATGRAPHLARDLWARHGLGDRIPTLAGDTASLHRVSGALRSGRRLLRLSLVQRNARLRLPFFLDYYRTLGVELFVVIDNGSTDGTVDYLAAQPDVCLYTTGASFAAAGSGMRWINGVMDLCPDDHWWVHADSDEFLVLPDPGVALPDRIPALEAQGAEIVQAFMLDMFPRTTREGEAYREGEDPLLYAPYFDASYRLTGAVAAPYLSVTGGVRQRISDTGTASPTPLLVKTALTRGVRYVNSHGTTPGRPARIRGTFLHYKFIGPFRHEVRGEIARKEHYQNASLYRTLDDGLGRIDAAPDWLGPDSLRYEGPEQLERMGLIASGRSN